MEAGVKADLEELQSGLPEGIINKYMFMSNV